ncbi:uncharacterized protein BDCG_01060 [Blastomyces dermatitidis ER-3]|uniref:Uncharacterized protein n=1 Tax=Ajellomyces dermatitidis (strain ER-3 / ATCC MYA-2586) TaxID=559297 RepID=A0ABP2EPQ7_AJEDR|nr:uncharacterized protein BDCG_01060 [Blastomyces dermatitidis ER-3]EEQ84255.2 hypothetical protein BDCG_01060 [Blastomyces dermatitidis ER-3]
MELTASPTTRLREMGHTGRQSIKLRLYRKMQLMTLHAGLAFIKMPPPEHEASLNELQRERDIYRLASVKSAASFRKLYDVSSDSMDMGKTDPKSIRYVAFEWLETTLQDVEYRPDIHSYALIGAVLRTALDSCAILEDKTLVNTGRVSNFEALAFAD